MNETFKKLNNCFSVTGSEKEVRDIIKGELSKFDVREDSMGNLILKLGEDGQKIMVCCHMDNPGVMVKSIEKNGFACAASIGEIPLKNFENSFVKFKNGTLAKTYVKDSSNDVENIYLDFGRSETEVRKIISEGDTAEIAQNTYELGKNIVGAKLSSTSGCYILLNVIKNLKKTKNDQIYFVFSSQNQIGGIGAKRAAYEIEPDMCIVVNSDKTRDVLGGDYKVKLKGGPVVTVMDKNLIASHEVNDIIETASKNLKMPIQRVITKNATEAGNIHKQGSGVKTGVISVPCRYKDSTSEMICMDDVKDIIKLIETILEGNN